MEDENAIILPNRNIFETEKICVCFDWGVRVEGGREAFPRGRGQISLK